MIFEDNNTQVDICVTDVKRITGTYRVREDTVGRDKIRITRLQKVTVESDKGITELNYFDKSFNADTESNKTKQVEEIFTNFLGGMPVKLKASGLDKVYRFGEHSFSIRFLMNKKDETYAEITTVFKM